MHTRPVTWTGRGLRLAYIGDMILAATAAIYFLNYSGKLAAFGFVIAAFVGLLSVQRAWLGRREFGPAHQRNVKRGLILFFVGAFLFVYALLAGLTNVPQTLDFRNMRPPVLGAALALIAETSSATFLLLELVGSKRRAFALAYGVAGGLLALVVLSVGFGLVSEYESARLPTAGIAQDRLMMFVAEFLPYVMASFLVTRVFALVLIRLARKEVEVAEHDALQPTDVPPQGIPPPQ